MFLMFSLFYRSNTGLIEDLPSPISLEDACRHHNDGSYHDLLSKSKKQMKLIMDMHQSDRNALMGSWVNKYLDSRHKIQTGMPLKLSMPHKYVITSEMDQTDLCRLDLIFMSQGAEPVFQTRIWYSLVYSSAARSKGFDIGDSQSKVPDRFFQKSGPSFSFGLPSYDSFVRDESRAVEKYASHAFDQKFLIPMTMDRYRKKLAAALANSSSGEN